VELEGAPVRSARTLPQVFATLALADAKAVAPTPFGAGMSLAAIVPVKLVGETSKLSAQLGVVILVGTWLSVYKTESEGTLSLGTRGVTFATAFAVGKSALVLGLVSPGAAGQLGCLRTWWAALSTQPAELSNCLMELEGRLACRAELSRLPLELARFCW